MKKVSLINVRLKIIFINDIKTAIIDPPKAAPLIINKIPNNPSRCPLTYSAESMGAGGGLGL